MVCLSGKINTTSETVGLESKPAITNNSKSNIMDSDVLNVISELKLQFKQQDDRIKQQDERISHLESKIVEMSMELAMGKAEKDECRLKSRTTGAIDWADGGNDNVSGSGATNNRGNNGAKSDESFAISVGTKNYKPRRATFFGDLPLQRSKPDDPLSVRMHGRRRPFSKSESHTLSQGAILINESNAEGSNDDVSGASDRQHKQLLPRGNSLRFSWGLEQEEDALDLEEAFNEGGASERAGRSDSLNSSEKHNPFKIMERKRIEQRRRDSVPTSTDELELDFESTRRPSNFGRFLRNLGQSKSDISNDTAQTENTSRTTDEEETNVKEDVDASRNNLQRRKRGNARENSELRCSSRTFLDTVVFPISFEEVLNGSMNDLDFKH